MKTALLGFALLVLANVAPADTFDYVLTDHSLGITFTWSLTTVPDTPPILPQFSQQVGQPGDIIVSANGVFEPTNMTMSTNSLIFQCDPTLLCSWDEAAPIDIITDMPLLNGTQLLSGSSFDPQYAMNFNSPGKLTLLVTDSTADAPEPGIAWMLAVIPLLFFNKKRGK